MLLITVIYDTRSVCRIHLAAVMRLLQNVFHLAGVML